MAPGIADRAASEAEALPPGTASPISLGPALLWVQGLYYLATGVWPLVSLDTFEMVTGPKTDHWLVKTVGVLIVAVSLALLCGAWRKRTVAEVIVLALASAVVLTAIDVVYVTRGVIPPIYLLDAAAEVVLVGGWVAVLAWGRRAVG
jgi:hypothetical protein